MNAVITDIRRPRRRSAPAYTVTLLLPDGRLRDYPLTAASLNELAHIVQALILGITLREVAVTIDRQGRVFTRAGANPAEHTGTWAPTEVPR